MLIPSVYTEFFVPAIICVIKQLIDDEIMNFCDHKVSLCLKRARIFKQMQALLCPYSYLLYPNFIDKCYL